MYLQLSSDHLARSGRECGGLMAELNSLPSLLNPIDFGSLGTIANTKGYWKFDDVGGTTVTDLSGLSHSGVASRADINGGAAGKLGYCGTFVSASSDKVTLADHADLHPTTTFMIGAWVKTSTAAQQCIFQSYGTSSGNPAGFTFFIDATGHLQVFVAKGIAGGSDTAYKNLTSITTINDGNWHQVTLTRVSGYWILSIDNQYAGDMTWGDAAYGTNFVLIGAGTSNGSTFTDYFNGQIDDVFIVNGSILDQSQQSRLFGAIAYWRMEGNSNAAKGGVNGVDTAITYGTTTGKYGQGGRLQRANFSKIVMGTSGIFKVFNALSFCGWFNITNNPVSYCAIANCSLSGFARGYAFDMSTTSVSFMVGDNSSWGSVSVAIPAPGWHFYVGTWDGATVSLYLDGVAVGTPASKASISYTDCGLTIGNYYNDATPDNMFDGYVDDISLFRRALTADEVLTLYKEQASSAWFMFM